MLFSVTLFLSFFVTCVIQFCKIVAGFMMSALDIGGVSVTLILSYLGSKGHKTRWVAAGTILVAVSCFLRAVPHFIFGPGQDALELTLEYGHMDGSEHKNFSNG